MWRNILNIGLAQGNTKNAKNKYVNFALVKNAELILVLYNEKILFNKEIEKHCEQF